MITWLIQNASTVIVGAIVSIVIGAAAVCAVRKKKNGCCGDCGRCNKSCGHENDK